MARTKQVEIEPAQEKVTEIGEVIVNGNVLGTPNQPFYGRQKSVSEYENSPEKEKDIIVNKDALVTEEMIEDRVEDVSILVAKDAALTE